MKLSIEKSALVAGLQAVQNVVSTRSTLPILSNVLITAEKETIYLSTTDLDISIQCAIEGKIDVSGSTTIPVKRLLSIVRELPDGVLDLESDEKNQTSVTSGASYFKIVGLSSEEFPAIPEADGDFFYLIDQNVFREMLCKTVYAASADETRYVLNGVMLSFADQKLTAVATDGRRLAMVENEIEFPAEAEMDMILPTKAVLELMHVLKESGNLKIYPKKNQVVFSFEGVIMASKLIEGTFPNFRQVIPSHCEQRVTLERELLLMALRRASLIIADRSSATKLTFDNNKLVILTTTPDVGESRESIPIKYEGDAITVAFNPDYMMDPLKNLSTDEVFIELTDNLSPAVIKCDIPFLYVLMPMRID